MPSLSKAQLSIITYMPMIAKSNRIEYIDAMRGFTMFIVVLTHCWRLTCLREVLSFPLVGNTVFSTFRMPLFFFVSGFVFYKARRHWSLMEILNFLKKKIPVQIVTPAVFMFAYFLIFGCDIHSGLTDSGKYGYWFTFTLFEFFIFYIISAVISDAVAPNNQILNDVIIIGFCLFFFLLSFPHFNNYLPISESVKGFLGFHNFSRYPYFVFGVMVRQYFNKFEHLLDCKMFILICVVVFFTLNIISLTPWNTFVLDHDVLTSLLMAFTGIIIVFALFRSLKSCLSSEKRFGRVIQYVGRRTLDIYLFHYFFLPVVSKGLEFSIPLIQNLHEPFSRFIVGSFDFLTSILVICGCLIVAKVIRLIPFVDHWMFGAKKT